MSADSKQDGGAAGAAWREDKKSGLLENIARTGDFWRRTMGIYAAYKATQVRAALLRLQGKDDETINAQVWTPQHQWAGEQMYDLCVSLRGFYLKAGQFIGARGDFVPEPICRKLSLLHDRVPPMPPAKAKEILTRELGVSDLGDVFEWIDLETPLGSASISQVHKGQLKRFSADELSAAQRAARGRALTQHTVEHVVRDGETAWDIANLYGVSVDELEAANRQGKGRSSYCQVDWLHPGQRIRVPSLEGLNSTEGSDKQSAPSNSSSSSSGSGAAARAAVLHAVSSGLAPQDGLVAVKIQYPDALGAMTLDLRNIRAAAAYLQKTELKFDMTSAVDELRRQITLEFDFLREARVMDAVCSNLSHLRKHITIPHSVPGLVTKRVLVMNFVDGVPLTEAASKIGNLSKAKREIAKRLILGRVSEAYGHMMLGQGLFQADGHPGNILVMKGGRIALLDFGQSKQLPPWQVAAFASLIVALASGDKPRVSASLDDLGLEIGTADVAIRSQMAHGMFDTTGKVDPFDPDSPIKKAAISKFPRDMFFVLRVVQLLRGMADGMAVRDFSSARQWAPLAKEALKRRHRETHTQAAQLGGAAAAAVSESSGAAALSGSSLLAAASGSKVAAVTLALQSCWQQQHQRQRQLRSLADFSRPLN